MTTAAVYGTGSWGTAYAMVLADAGTRVRMWGRRSEMVAQINGGCNETYLPGVALPGLVTATDDPAEAADLVKGPEREYLLEIAPPPPRRRRVQPGAAR